jgi:hypothetical protein
MKRTRSIKRRKPISPPKKALPTEPVPEVDQPPRPPNPTLRDDTVASRPPTWLPPGSQSFDDGFIARQEAMHRQRLVAATSGAASPPFPPAAPPNAQAGAPPSTGVQGASDSQSRADIDVTPPPTPQVLSSIALVSRVTAGARAGSAVTHTTLGPGGIKPPYGSFEGKSASAGDQATPDASPVQEPVASPGPEPPVGKGIFQAPFGEGVFAEAIQRETSVGSALVGQAPGRFAPTAWGEGAFGEGTFGGQPADATERIAAWRSARRARVLSTGGAVEQLDLPLRDFPPKVPGPDLSAWGGPQLNPPTPPPSLEFLEDEEAVEVIKEWFFSNFDDPGQETSRNDGEFQYIWGGPYDARDVIEGAFEGAVSEEIIEAAADAVEDTGIYDWAPHGSRVQSDEGNQLTLPLGAGNSNSSAPVVAIEEISSTTPLPVDGPAPTAGTSPTFAGPSAILPDINSVPLQVKAASQFWLDAEGRIDLLPDPPFLEETQREFFEEMRHKAIALAGIGHNQLAELAEPVDRFRAALPENIENVSISRVWSRGNTLRRRLRAHEVAGASGEPFDPARLAPAVAEGLRDLVETFNVFIVGDPGGRELDQVRLGPQDRHAAQAVLDAARPIIEAVGTSQGVATTAAVETLTEQIEAARDVAPGIDGDQAIELSRKTSSNFIVTLARSAYASLRSEPGFAWKEYRAGAYRGLGAMTVAGLTGWQIISFVQNNAEALKTFVEHAFHNPTLIQIIEVISKIPGT